MLSHKALHFSRADIFTDKWEGAVPELIFKKLKDELSDEDTENTKTFIKKLKELTFVNCWHINEFESAAMWDLYGSSDGTIAIESDIKTLEKVFLEINQSSTDMKFEMNSVEYIDYKVKYDLTINPRKIFFYKRKSFEHEKEVRAIYWKILNKLESDDQGLLVNIDIVSLIKKVHISPYASPWLESVIRDLLEKYHLNNIEVQRSNLYSIK